MGDVRFLIFDWWTIVDSLLLEIVLLRAVVFDDCQPNRGQQLLMHRKLCRLQQPYGRCNAPDGYDGCAIMLLAMASAIITTCGGYSNIATCNNCSSIIAYVATTIVVAWDNYNNTVIAWSGCSNVDAATYVAMPGVTKSQRPMRSSGNMCVHNRVVTTIGVTLRHMRVVTTIWGRGDNPQAVTTHGNDRAKRV